VRLTALALATACAVALATAASARHADGTVTRLLPPPDGQAYFGFTFRLWDTSDPEYGDSRQFDERIRDSVANELAGRRRPS
jgi:hypothetical protein